MFIKHQRRTDMGVAEMILIAIVFLPGVVILADDSNFERKKPD